VIPSLSVFSAIKKECLFVGYVILQFFNRRNTKIDRAKNKQIKQKLLFIFTKCAELLNMQKSTS